MDPYSIGKVPFEFSEVRNGQISPGFAENTTILSIAAYTNHNEAMKLLISPLVKHLFLVSEQSLLEKIILENGGAFKYHIL